MARFVGDASFDKRAMNLLEFVEPGIARGGVFRLRARRLVQSGPKRFCCSLR